MASLIDELINVLTLENEEYRILLKLSQEKTPVIVKGDIEMLREITGKEEYHLDKIVKAEKKRVEVLDDMATVLNIDKKNITLKALVDVLKAQPNEQKKLSTVHDELKATLKEFGMVNDMNKSLLNDQRDMVEFELNLIRGRDQAPELANYSSDSKYNQMSGAMQTGLFDAKQ